MQPREGSRTSVAVLAVHGELRALAAEDIAAGDVALELEGILVPEPTRYSVQVGEGQHLEVPAGVTWEQLLARYPWRYLNHACNPNTRVAGPAGRSLIALVDIPRGSELRFDYEANELELAEPFPCRCGDCDGHLVRGFAHLEPEQQLRRLPLLPEHLLRRLDRGGQQANMEADRSDATADEHQPPTR
ncbi:MAG: SET domain-containing protein [Planctomycetota bacterium]|nr:SET domain-containing protein [Planctomycetota bacterium]